MVDENDNFSVSWIEIKKFFMQSFLQEIVQDFPINEVLNTLFKDNKNEEIGLHKASRRIMKSERMKELLQGLLQVDHLTKW